MKRKETHHYTLRDQLLKQRHLNVFQRQGLERNYTLHLVQNSSTSLSSLESSVAVWTGVASGDRTYLGAHVHHLRLASGLAVSLLLNIIFATNCSHIVHHPFFPQIFNLKHTRAIGYTSNTSGHIFYRLVMARPALSQAPQASVLTKNELPSTSPSLSS